MFLVSINYFSVGSFFLSFFPAALEFPSSLLFSSPVQQHLPTYPQVKNVLLHEHHCYGLLHRQHAQSKRQTSDLWICIMRHASPSPTRILLSFHLSYVDFFFFFPFLSSLFSITISPLTMFSFFNMWKNGLG